jgi:hypothetical protein
MAIGIEGRLGRCMPQADLNGLHIQVGGDQQTREVMPQVVEPEPIWHAHSKAEKWLEAYLSKHGPTPSKKVKAMAGHDGHSEASIKRAKDAIDIHVGKIPGTHNETTWELPTPPTTPTPLVELTELTDLTEPTNKRVGSEVQSAQSALLGQGDADLSRLLQGPKATRNPSFDRHAPCPICGLSYNDPSSNPDCIDNHCEGD